MIPKLLYFLTRTPLHVGAGASVGAIDQPIQRERHTGFPVIPATGQKGSFADGWPVERLVFKEVEKDGKKIKELEEIREAAWLFGSDTTDLPFAGALIFSEARVLAFPIRSAKGGYAWITCPLMLQRAARDGVFGASATSADGAKTNAALAELAALAEPLDDRAVFLTGQGAKLDLGGQIVLEEYCFNAHEGANYPAAIATALAGLVVDSLFKTIVERLVILSNGMMSHFATTACEIAQHVRINDETGTADDGGLFNQENVPADTLFYAVLTATPSRVPQGTWKGKTDTEALAAFITKVGETKVFQFGGDATTGLGWCSVSVAASEANEDPTKGDETK